jgi:hypothetical protein
MKKLKQSKKKNVNDMEKLSSKIKEATYENIVVDCPYDCHKELIFNRISDLHTIMPISGQNLRCEHCKKTFWVSGDLVSAKYKWFLSDLYLLKREKRYGLYIFALCQSCEVFMHQAIINKLIDTNPAYRDDEGRFCCNNEVGADAYSKIHKAFHDKKISEIINNGLKDSKDSKQYKDFSFFLLRKLFIFIFNDARKNKSPSLKKSKEDRIAKCFRVIENTKINEIRNNVAHKDAYRPSLSDVEKNDELVGSLYWLGAYLNVEDSLFYLNQKICNQRKT